MMTLSMMTLSIKSLNTVMLSVELLNVAMLSVVAPVCPTFILITFGCHRPATKNWIWHWEKMNGCYA